MKVANNILELFGKTPLVKLNHITKDIKASVYAKMESMNPGASVKDRIGLAMIEDAEKRGLLKPGGTIIEATSGNTGIGLAITSAVKGYRCIFTMTEKVSMEKRRYLQALGADVVICPMTAKHDSPENYVNVAKRINTETPNSLFIYQYNNPSNPDAHYHTTGPELWEQTQGKITHFVGSLGTGGTVSGTGRFLKEKNPEIKIIAADPYGSIFKTYKESGVMTEGTPYLVEGIGQDMLPENVHFKYIDEIINITDKESFHLSRRMGREEGIFSGGSTGTNLAAALRVAKDLDKNGLVVFIVCDTGERYLTKHHSDEWMREKRLLEKDKTTLGVVHQTKLSGGLPNMIFASPEETVGEALARIEQYNVSQIPVIEGNRSVGSLDEADIMSMILEDPATVEKKVSEIMGKAYPVVDESEDIKHGIQYLKESSAILVSQYGRIVGILTRYDVLDFV
ncbi:MAG: cystathionine beta-synthase [Chlorobi bacterium OLB5]|nr:MAG: cystathionine beta-synthase [Chlorobi bacterium OLB5]